MSDNLEYYVLPNKPNNKQFVLTETEKNEIQGLDFQTGFAYWSCILIVVFIIVSLLCLALRLDNLAAIIGIIIALVGASVAIVPIASSVKKKNILEYERRRIEETNRANQNEFDRLKNEAMSLTSSVVRTYESSTELTTELPQYLNQASHWLREAEIEYNDNAFSPFWDAVENAVEQLAVFNDKANQLSQNADEYYRKLKGRDHTFPAFPVSIGTIPDASFVVKELRRVVRMGQTNFQFANIWEHRRTREVLIAGFRTLGDAVNNLGAALENSIYNLQQSVSSDLAKVIEEEIKTRETLDKRMVEQNRMLDNLQHHRKPDITDKLSRY